MNDLGTVLVVFGDALSAPESCYSLMESGFSVVALCRKNQPCGIRKSKRVSTVDVFPPEIDYERCLNEIEAASQKYNAIAVLPLDDVSLWILNKGRSRFTCSVVIPDTDAVTVALDKRLQISAAADAGFDVPTTAHSTDSLSTWTCYPSIVKGSLACDLNGDGIGKSKVHFCRNQSDLEHTGFQFGPNNDLILQEWHQGTGVGVFGIRTKDGITGWSGHRRIRMMNPAGSGSSCCESENPSLDIRNKVERFLASIEWTGIFMIELLRDTSGVEWFMELNGRTWGSTALARAQGLEFPSWAVMCALGMNPDIPSATTADPVKARHLGRECIHWMHAMRGPGKHTGLPWPSRLRTTCDLLFSSGNSHWYNFRKEDRSVFWSDTLSTIKSQIRKRPAQ